MTDTPVLELKERQSAGPMHRAINHGMMVAWINRNLTERAGLDVRTALVLYDEDGDFMHALPPILGPVPSVGLQNALLQSGVRYYSTGIV